MNDRFGALDSRFFLPSCLALFTIENAYMRLKGLWDKDRKGCWCMWWLGGLGQVELWTQEGSKSDSHVLSQHKWSYYYYISGPTAQSIRAYVSRLIDQDKPKVK